MPSQKNLLIKFIFTKFLCKFFDKFSVFFHNLKCLKSIIFKNNVCKLVGRCLSVPCVLGLHRSVAAAGGRILVEPDGYPYPQITGHTQLYSIKIHRERKKLDQRRKTILYLCISMYIHTYNQTHIDILLLVFKELAKRILKLRVRKQDRRTDIIL